MCTTPASTALVQYRSRRGRESVFQGTGKFGKFGGGKSCSVVYCSARSSGTRSIAQVLLLPFEYYYYLFSKYPKFERELKISVLEISLPRPVTSYVCPTIIM